MEYWEKVLPVRVVRDGMEFPERLWLPLDPWKVIQVGQDLEDPEIVEDVPSHG